MKQGFFIIALLLICLSHSFGQSKNDSITIRKGFGGYQFLQNDKVLRMNQLIKAMESNSVAYKEIKSAQSSYTLAMICGYAGGFMVGWPIGTAIAGGEPNWVLAGVGAGIIVASIPISKKFNRQAKQAVDTYNGGLQTSSFWDRNELNLSLTSNGVGLALNF